MTTDTLSVVVGRFHVPTLHAGHLHLLKEAARAGDALLVVLGSPRSLPTERNPLPFALRAAMIAHAFPMAQVVELFDTPCDRAWSNALDAVIHKHANGKTARLFGSRSSFIPYYHGKYNVVEVSEMKDVSGTALRTALMTDVPHTADFRAGVIYREAVRGGIAYPALDVAVIDRHKKLVLLGEKKHDNGKWRFIGGFFDPALDSSLEGAAKREVWEEASMIEVADTTYLGSTIIDDWRYRGTKDKILSSFFAMTYVFGSAVAKDDIDALHWTPYEDVCAHLVPEHAPLGALLMKHLAEIQ
jgi:bifunctional NMN adenylyltransferase/nudix hydrolase